MFVGDAGTQKAEIEGARSQAETLVYKTKKYQDDIQKLGLGIKQHEDIIKFLRTRKNSIDESILNLQVTIGKYYAPMQPVTEEEEAQSEDETNRNILKLEKSAAGLICQLKTRHGSQVSHSPLVKDVMGIVATLGKVDDENLSRLLAEYLGKNTMLALVCKNFDGVQAMESCDIEGAVNRNSGLHGLGSSIGRTIDGRFLVICLDHLRPYVGKFIADDPQRRLDLLKPKLAGGEIPRGFLGYAVNLIYINRENLSCVTTSGHGLRETLFYHLFSRLQVYRTKEDMMQTLPFITDGALSLDGGIIRSPGVFHLGYREEPEVKFPRISEKSSLPGNYDEIENSLRSKKWNLERLLEDMRKEQSMLDQAKFMFEIKKQEFVRFLAQSSHHAPASLPL
ncbi:protein DEFECTIVE IN MERISTEM SILENCING 3-like [Apium graveolens]|uniref:protein DEFECTIVE IN MERISTEM SILENCING 3-like n=1 Tax=Apium graveolens TaxID=4045 RepID=UPI003D7B39AF